MTVVVNTRDDFTLANFRRVCYGGEPVRLGDQARRALAAAGGAARRREGRARPAHGRSLRPPRPRLLSGRGRGLGRRLSR